MARVPVPEDYDADAVPLPSGLDYEDYATAIEGHAGRRALVREDGGGRYVGVHEALVEDVAAFLGVAIPSTTDSDVVEGGTTTDADVVEGDATTCQAVKTDGEVCGRELPCPYHSEDDE